MQQVRDILTILNMHFVVLLIIFDALDHIENAERKMTIEINEDEFLKQTLKNGKKNNKQIENFEQN